MTKAYDQNNLQRNPPLDGRPHQRLNQGVPLEPARQQLLECRPAAVHLQASDGDARRALGIAGTMDNVLRREPGKPVLILVVVTTSIRL